MKEELIFVVISVLTIFLPGLESGRTIPVPFHLMCVNSALTVMYTHSLVKLVNSGHVTVAINLVQIYYRKA